jgi:maltokinase
MAGAEMAEDAGPPVDLAEWMAGQRWFATKTRRIVATTVEERLSIADATLYVVRVTVEGQGAVAGDAAADRYVVALARGSAIVDAFDSPGFCRALLQLVETSAERRGERGALVGRPTRRFPAALPADVRVRRIGGEQSNTSIVFGDALIMKYFRRLPEGVNPDLEITRFLTEHTTFRNTPRLAGALEYVDGAGGASTLAVAHELVKDGRDAWQWILDRLASGDGALEPLGRLGRRTAELHLALATPTTDPAFGVEPIGQVDVTAWAASLERQIEAAREAAGGALPEVPPGAADALGALVGGVKIRHHGDFHLGQTLTVGDGDDFMLIDFEGEPLRTLQERRRKHTPLRDVAGMLRSFAYAAATTARAGRDVGDWEAHARAAFLDGYRAAAGRAPFVPASSDAFGRALAALELEKAAYEVVYEANNRPDWLPIPVRGFVSATASLARWAGAA